MLPMECLTLVCWQGFYNYHIHGVCSVCVASLLINNRQHLAVDRQTSTGRVLLLHHCIHHSNFASESTDLACSEVSAIL